MPKPISVAQQVQGATAVTTTIEAPKYGSERIVYVLADLTDLLAAHVKARGISQPEEHLFRRPTGELHNRGSAGAQWRLIRRAARLPATMKLHTLRHTYASNLIAAGCDVVTVQRALGHTLPSITLNVYPHLWPSAEDKMRAAAKSFMSAVWDPPADSLRTSKA